MKITKKTEWYVLAFLFAFALEGCNGQTIKQEKNALGAGTDSATMSNKENFSLQSTLEESESAAQKKPEQSMAIKKVISQENIDEDKIY